MLYQNTMALVHGCQFLSMIISHGERSDGNLKRYLRFSRSSHLKMIKIGKSARYVCRLWGWCYPRLLVDEAFNIVSWIQIIWYYSLRCWAWLSKNILESMRIFQYCFLFELSTFPIGFRYRWSTMLLSHWLIESRWG